MRQPTWGNHALDEAIYFSCFIQPTIFIDMTRMLASTKNMSWHKTTTLNSPSTACAPWAQNAYRTYYTMWPHVHHISPISNPKIMYIKTIICRLLFFLLRPKHDAARMSCGEQDVSGTIVYTCTAIGLRYQVGDFHPVVNLSSKLKDPKNIW